MRPRKTFRLALLALAFGFASPAHAQEPDDEPRSLPGWSVERTMRGFLDAYPPRGFFPARGEWTWVLTTRDPDGRDRVGVHRFPAAQTDAAMAPGGPVCHVFSAGDAVVTGTIVEHAGGTGPWRRVGAARFVPPDRPANSPIFVEWRREDGRWVVSSFGEEREHYGRPADAGSDLEGVRNGPRGAPPRLPLPDSMRVAADAAWYRNHEPITVAGDRLTMYGLPVRLGENDIVRWGTLHGVAIYVEPGQLRARVPEVVYLPTDRSGLFQPYQNMTGNGCEH